MKKTFLLMLMLGTMMWSMAKDYSTPNFAFPKQVIADAEKRYEEAIRNNDGEALVDALIRWGLAKSEISQDYRDTILARIDTVRAHESRPDIRCLLDILHYYIVKERHMLNASKAYQLDFSEVDSLWQYPLSNYKHLIRAEKIDLMRIPTLADFLWSQDTNHAPLRTSDKELLPYLWQKNLFRYNNAELLALYEQYKNQAESGEILQYTQSADSLLSIYKEYTQKFPKSLWKNNILNKISSIEAKEISCNYPQSIHSNDSLVVRISNHRNLKQFKIRVYRCTKDKKSYGKIDAKDCILSKTYTIDLPCDSVSLAPLHYGHYCLQAEYTDDYGNVQRSEMYRHEIVTVTDVKQFVICYADSVRKFWVDMNDGHPVSRLAKGDLYPDTITTHRIYRNIDVAQRSARIFSDLNIYRPGETMKYTVICYSNSLHERKLLSNEKITVTLNDAFGKKVEEMAMVTDSMGQCQGAFVLPTDRANGYFSLQVKETGNKNKYSSLGSLHFNVSEYKLPHFSLQMQSDKSLFKENDTLHVTGHAETYNGVKMSGYQLQMTSPIDTILTTDVNGDFKISLATKDEWGIQFNVSLTDETGETLQASCYCRRTWNHPRNEKNLPEMELRDAGIDNQHRAQIEITVPWESYIFYIACARDSILGQGWLHYDQAGKYTYLQPLPTQMDEEVSIRFVSMHRGKITDKSITVRDTLLQHSIHLTMDCFRDKLLPGGKEQWNFHLSDVQGQPVKGRMLIEMYQQALEEMATNRWHWQVPFVSRNLYSYYGNEVYSVGTHLFWQRPGKKGLTPTLLELYHYNREFFNAFDNIVVGYGLTKSSVRIRGAAKQMNLVMDDEIEEECMVMDEAVNSQASGAEAPAASPSELEEAFATIPLRQMQTKVALWQPMLTTDDEGNISITIDIPEDNTTWRMQALAFSQHLTTDTLTRQMIVQRPVMVLPSLPRFLRHGDETELKAMVQNTQNHEVSADVLLEIFDPRTDKVLSSSIQKLGLKGNAQQAVSIRCNKSITMQSLPYIGFRIKAKAEGCSDGEQQMIPLLEASQPVIETTPFYLDPGGKEQILRFAGSTERNSKATSHVLEICNNPTWYAIMALPSVHAETGCSSPALGHQLYALSLAEGIANAQVKGMNRALAEKIRTSIEQWGKEKDSILVSPLLKNADLKIGTLKASPWLNSAEQQTLRMQSLQKLFDAKSNADIKSEIFKKLSALQNRDGGLSWIDYPNRMSSLYATGEVLELIGELHQLGLSTNWVGEERALAYYDSMQIVVLEELRKELQSKEKINYSRWCDYLYIRSMFEAPLPKANQSLMRKVIEATEKNWREWSLPIRAYIALSLKRAGHTEMAQTIVASLKEFAYNDGSRGTYWDNIPWMWCCRSQLSANALLLQTLHEVAPGTQEEDAVRRYLLLNKQSNDWGDASLASQVIYSLLSTGSDWLSGTDLQYTRRELTAKEISSRKVKVESAPNNPVWGALYVQRMAQMDSIKTHNIEDLKIQKEIIGADSIGAKAIVRITIDNRRDMEYVTIKDIRPACLEPADRVSGYRWNLNAYCETKDAETNFFVQWLPKGHHVFTYEVYVSQSGTFHAGASTIQCQYAPQLTAHSNGSVIKIK